MQDLRRENCTSPNTVDYLINRYDYIYNNTKLTTLRSHTYTHTHTYAHTRTHTHTHTYTY